MVVHPDERSLLYEESDPLKGHQPGREIVLQIWAIPTTYPGNLISKANILRAIVISEGCPASQMISNTYSIFQH